MRFAKDRRLAHVVPPVERDAGDVEQQEDLKREIGPTGCGNGGAEPARDEEAADGADCAAGCAPADGSAWIEGADCARRVVRAGSWFFAPAFPRSAKRYWFTTDHRLNYLGFRSLGRLHIKSLFLNQGITPLADLQNLTRGAGNGF